MGNYFDYTTGEFGFNMGDDSMLMNQDGDLLMRTSDTSAIDLETGEAVYFFADSSFIQSI